jgi:radical SAM protein with 4Fe4S-binding SPASM domain
MQDVPCLRPLLMANIFSNGDVVPCCYDFDSSMKIGNVNERPFTEIWNGDAMRQMRRRILTEREALPRCKACGINFKLSTSGWFPEVLDLTEEKLGNYLPGAFSARPFSGGRRLRPVEKGWRRWMPF